MGKNKINLHELLQEKTYDHAVICTYRFDPIFFEDYCLTKFNALKNNGNITVIVDHETYSNIIHSIEIHKPKQANLRYLLHPVSVPGVFHSKLYFFASKHKGRLIIGSSNLTRPGITSNAEMNGCYDFEEGKKEYFKPLFKAAYSLLIEISQKWPNETLRLNINEISADAAWLLDNNGAKDANNIYLLNNLDKSLWGQIASEVNKHIDCIYILSRYFDSSPFALDRIYKDLKPKKVKIFTQNGITTLTKDWLKHDLIKKGIADIFLCKYRDEEYPQDLHAKVIAIKMGNSFALAFGSANFTTPALFNSVEKGNYEILMLIKDIPEEDLNIEELMDPEMSAIQLKDDKVLISSPIEGNGGCQSNYEIKLHEVSLDGNRLRISALIPDNLKYDDLHAILIFQNTSQTLKGLKLLDGNQYDKDITDSMVRSLDESSTMIQLEAFSSDKKIAESNRMMIINLKDIQTGHGVKHERYIRQAQKSHLQFYNALLYLLKNDDKDALITFLSFCDIPVLYAARPPFMRGIRPEWNEIRGMSTLGHKNLNIFLQLHDVVMTFVNKHYKKLKKHFEHGSLQGISNYMHILLAMGGVIRSQIERAILGFEGKDDSMSIDEWFDYKRKFDIYYAQFKDMMVYSAESYLSRMKRDYNIKEIREQLEPDIPILHDLCHSMLDARDRIEKLRITKLKVGGDRHPPYFDCVLKEDNWQIYSSNIRKLFKSFEMTLS